LYINPVVQDVFAEEEHQKKRSNRNITLILRELGDIYNNHPCNLAATNLLKPFWCKGMPPYELSHKRDEKNSQISGRYHRCLDSCRRRAPEKEIQPQDCFNFERTGRHLQQPPVQSRCNESVETCLVQRHASLLETKLSHRRDEKFPNFWAISPLPRQLQNPFYHDPTFLRGNVGLFSGFFPSASFGGFPIETLRKHRRKIPQRLRVSLETHIGKMSFLQRRTSLPPGLVGKTKQCRFSVGRQK